MNFIATVNTPAHGHISVTFSDNEKSVLGAWRDNVTTSCPGKRNSRSPMTLSATVAISAYLRKRMSPPPDLAYSSSRYAAVASASQKSSSSPRRSHYGLKQSPGSTSVNRKQWGRGCVLPTMPSSAKTSPTKQESTRGVSRAGTT